MWVNACWDVSRNAGRRDGKALTCPNTITKSQKSSLRKSNWDLPEKNRGGSCPVWACYNEPEYKFNGATYDRSIVYTQLNTAQEKKCPVFLNLISPLFIWWKNSEQKTWEKERVMNSYTPTRTQHSISKLRVTWTPFQHYLKSFY